MAKSIRNSARGKAVKQDKEEYDNTNRGVLFENEKEGKTQPTFKGSFTDSHGVEFWLAAWEQESKGGVYYISLVATEKEVDEEIEAPVKRSTRKK